MPSRGFLGIRLQREIRAFRNRRQHLLFADNQRRGVVARDFKAVAMRDRVGRASFHTVAAEDAARIVDVVNLRIALAARNSQSLRIFGRFNINAVGRTGRGT